MLHNDFISQIFLGLISFLSNFISALSGGGAGLIQLPALIFFGLPFSKALATHKVASALEKGKPKNKRAGSCIKPAPPPDKAEMKLEKSDISPSNI